MTKPVRMYHPTNLDGIAVLPTNVARMEANGWHADRDAARKADPAKPAPAPAKDPRPKGKADRIAAIRAAMFEIDPSNSGQVTNDGKPEVKALEILLGWAPTKAERDEAFEAQTK